MLFLFSPPTLADDDRDKPEKEDEEGGGGVGIILLLFNILLVNMSTKLLEEFILHNYFYPKIVTQIIIIV